MSFSNPVRIDRYLGASATITPISKVNWRILMPKHGDLNLHHLPLLSTDQGEDVFTKLKKEYDASQSLLKKIVPFLVPVVYAATLSPVKIEDISGPLPLIVDIDEKHRSHVLTNAMHTPDTLSRTADFLTSYRRFAVIQEAPGSICQRDALLIKLELHKVMLLMFLTISLLVSIGLGVMAGLLRHNVDSGLGVWGAILGVVGIVEGFLTWKLKNEE
ncbi:hypothetical protein V501_03894 [Pseudogymnoascus sp. VKM F-4519 (FW-2642)]|nr:hypothetical protein V501_03894 [Pseudogymnoascus sp. VKM F-4519 (FW-2642)]